MNIKNIGLWFVDTFSQNLKSALTRFLTANVLILVYSGIMIYQVCAENEIIERHLGIISFYFFTAILLDIALCLWRESSNVQVIASVSVSVLCHLLLLADAIYLWDVPEFNILIVLPQAAIVCIVLLALVFVSFRKENDDNAVWNFTKALIIGGIQCWCICFALFLVLWGLELSLEFLFSISNSSCTGIMMIISFITVPSLLMLTRIPSDSEKYKRDFTPMTFLMGAIRYLFIPVIGLYLLMLYVFAVTIIITWQLPDGNVVLPVSILAVASIALEILLYPTANNKERKFEQKVAKFLPFLVLPLLLLMSIAIGRRISDYGITIGRLYVVALNIWFYVVFTIMAVSKTRRIYWIPISFAAVLVLTTCLPVNICSVTKNHIMTELERLINKNRPNKLPIETNYDFELWISSLPKNTGDEIIDNMQYIKSFYGKQELAKWVNKECSVCSVDETEDDAINYRSADKTVSIPKGFDRFVKVDDYSPAISTDSLKRKFVTIHIEKNDSVTFALDYYELSRDTNVIYLVSADSAYMFKVEQAHIDLANTNYSEINGYLFSKSGTTEILHTK